MSINKNDIMKTAASHLRSLSAEVQNYRDMDERRTHVENIMEKLAENMESNEVMSKYAEYMQKDVEELRIIEKALELSKTGELNLGSLSTQAADNGDLDPLTALLVDDYLQ